MDLLYSDDGLELILLPQSFSLRGVSRSSNKLCTLVCTSNAVEGREELALDL